MHELYLTLIKAQDNAILSADKASNLGLVDTAAKLNRLVSEVSRIIIQIETDGVVS